MEEIVTIDGRQFKLTTDRPLTASEKAQVIADIRKQSGCGTCHQPRVANMSNDWQYGGVRSLAPTCPAGTKGSGPLDAPVNLAAAPVGGVAPYSVYYYIKRNTEAPILIVAASGLPGTITQTAGNPELSVPESPNGTTTTTTAFSYKLADDDINVATGDDLVDAYTATGEPGGPATGGVTEGKVAAPGPGAIPLASGKIRFLTVTTDSCPTGARGCVEYCDVTLLCIAPTCNFVVS